MINCAVILARQGEFAGGKVNQTGSDLNTSHHPHVTYMRAVILFAQVLLVSLHCGNNAI